MSEKEVMWTVFAAGVPLILSIFAIVKAFVQPMLGLTKSITELDISITQLKDIINTQTLRINKHSQDISELKDKTTRHEVEIIEIKTKIKECKKGGNKIED